jgi:hypothetical protein
MSLREAFFAVPAEPAYEDVPMPFGVVRVVAMSAGEKDQFDIENTKAEGQDFRARLVVATAFEEAGRPIFTKADIPALSKRPIYQIEPLIEATIRVNRISEKDQETLRKNSPSQEADSSTG